MLQRKDQAGRHLQAARRPAERSRKRTTSLLLYEAKWMRVHLLFMCWPSLTALTQ